jgi:hypothetical protein
MTSQFKVFRTPTEANFPKHTPIGLAHVSLVIKDVPRMEYLDVVFYDNVFYMTRDVYDVYVRFTLDDVIRCDDKRIRAIISHSPDIKKILKDLKIEWRF